MKSKFYYLTFWFLCKLRVFRVLCGLVFVDLHQPLLWAVGTGTTELEFVKIVPGARESSLGECSSIFANTISGAQINPSQLAFTDKLELTGSYLLYFAGTQYNFLGFAVPITDRVAVGINAINFNAGTFAVRDLDGVSVGEITYLGKEYSLSAGAKVFSNFSIGINGKLASREMGINTNSFVTDFGIMYSTSNFAVSGSLQNISKDNLPTTVRFGTGYRFDYTDRQGTDRKIWTLSTMVELVKGLTDTQPWLNLGLEYTIYPVSARVGGTFLGRKDVRLSVGAGIKVKELSLDYAYVPYPDLGDTHRVTVSLGYRLTKKESVQVKLIPKEKRVTVAVLNLDARGVSEKDTVMISEMLRTALFNTNTFIIVERGRLDQVMAELGLQETGCTDQSCVIKVGALLNAQKIVTGTVGELAGTYHINIRLVDVKTGEVDYSDKGKTSELDRMESEIDKIAARLSSTYK